MGTDITKADVKWKSDAASVVEVSSNGEVKAIAEGKATITAYVQNAGGKIVSSDTRTITVKKTTIKLNYTSATIYGNETLQLKATVEGPSQAVTWKSSSSLYITVDGNGLVKMGSMETLKDVSATITATANGVSATCKVTRVAGLLKFANEETFFNVGVSKTVTVQSKGVSTVKYYSNNSVVAAVDVNTGKVTPKKEGQAVITASGGGLSASYTVKVKPTIKLSKTSLSMNKGTSGKLIATVMGSTAKKTWKSSNSSVVSVTKSGKLKAKKAGKATITVTINSKYGKVSQNCTVTVVNPSIKLNFSKATLNVGGTLTLRATVKGVSQKVTWSSSKKSIATVSSSGKVTAKKAGKVTITAKANGKKARCVITVRKKYTLSEMNNRLNKYMKKKFKYYVSFLSEARERSGKYYYYIRYQGGNSANTLSGLFSVDPYTGRGVYESMWGQKQNWKI